MEPFGKGSLQAVAINCSFDELISGTYAFSVFAGRMGETCLVCVAACLELRESPSLLGAGVRCGLCDCLIAACVVCVAAAWSRESKSAHCLLGASVRCGLRDCMIAACVVFVCACMKERQQTYCLCLEFLCGEDCVTV